MSKKRIVIVEDERDMADLVARRLTREGYAVDVATDGLTGLDKIRSRPTDLALVDIMLPHLSGTDLVKEVRQDPLTANVPIIMMTAKGEENDVVVGLALGADDYVAKPFSLSVLVARVAAVLRRATAGATGKGPLKIGPLAIDTDRHLVKVDDEVVALTRTEFRLLVALAGARGRVLTRNQLIDQAMGANTIVTDRTIDVHLTALRKKLGEARSCLQTVRGVGYRLIPEDE
jgi:two-component system, OmpR family, phosphate regulon response regulator PhoB